MTALPDGKYDVPAGKLAMIVTHLEMRAPVSLPHAALPEGVELRAVTPDVGWYREIFDRVGADWLWFARLLLSDAELAAIITHGDVEVFTLTRDGEDLALLELDFRGPGACQLAYFGLAAPLIGNGAGRALMQAAIDRAWMRPIDALRVHTCSIDHPRALDFYRRSGFDVTRQQVEIADDPRASGLLPRDKGAHVPLIGG